MARPTTPRPTDAELEILNVLWEQGPSTVREVLYSLQRRREIGYTSVLKLMQIMLEKGAVLRDSEVRPQVYRAARPRRQTQRQLVRDLARRAFGGTPAELALAALSSRRTTAEERAAIQDLLDRHAEDEPR